MSDVERRARETIAELAIGEPAASELIARAIALDEADERAAAGDNDGLGGAMAHYVVQLIKTLRHHLKNTTDPKAMAALEALDGLVERVEDLDQQEIDNFRRLLNDKPDDPDP